MGGNCLVGSETGTHTILPTRALLKIAHTDVACPLSAQTHVLPEGFKFRGPNPFSIQCCASDALAPLHDAQFAVHTFQPNGELPWQVAGGSGGFFKFIPPQSPFPSFGKMSVHCGSGPGGGFPGKPGKLHLLSALCVTSNGGTIEFPDPPHLAVAVAFTDLDRAKPRTGA